MAHEAIAVWEMLEDTMQADLLERASWASALPRSAPVDITPSPADCSSPREHVIEIALIRIARNREIGEDFSPPGSPGIATVNDIFRPLQHQRASARSPSSIGV
jgi:hypothetical protein